MYCHTPGEEACQFSKYVFRIMMDQGIAGTRTSGVSPV